MSNGIFQLQMESRNDLLMWMPKIKKHYLLSPGPTPVPPQVSLAGAKALIHHRTPQFSKIIQETADGLKYLFCTQNPVYTFAASGTGAMEAAVTNLLSPGDKMIVIEGGKFGERWSEIGRAFGGEVINLKIAYGDAPSLEQVETLLKKHPDAKGLFTQLSETSTGCVLDIEGIAKLTSKTQTPLVVDAISGLGAEPCYTDRWNVDAIVAGSQKGVMLPPGLAFLSFNDRAWQAVEKSKMPHYYFDLKKTRTALEKADTPFTPPISLYFQLQEALKLIRDETLEGILARHFWLASATRAGVGALGLELFAKRPGNVLTAIRVPSGLDGEKLVTTMRDDLGAAIVGGQGEMKGKVIRIAHLGYMDRFDITTAISGLEIALRRMGYPIKLGTGVAAAQEILWKDPE